MLNPLPILYKWSRWWFIKMLYRLATPGIRRVEFTDFWMGDQFCSLVFTLTNMFYVGCAYKRGLDNWQQCTEGRYWGPEFALACIPFLIRVIQSIKRWVDSRLITHLINAGKYAAGLLMYLCYYLWRQHGGGRGVHFVVWCIFATNYSLYASSWDILMDWSLLQPHAKYPLLRSELLYPSYVPLYYMAIVTNVLIRFIWVFYIPGSGPNYVLRTFIAGSLESFRRWQWNFIRLENEHLGNVDQYRVTREVPLPYALEDMSRESDDEDDRDNHSRSRRRRKTQDSSTEHMEQGSES
ncbi:EXS-domain-containing protein [Sparassis latifolia]